MCVCGCGGDVWAQCGGVCCGAIPRTGTGNLGQGQRQRQEQERERGRGAAAAVASISSNFQREQGAVRFIL